MTTMPKPKPIKLIVLLVAIVGIAAAFFSFKTLWPASNQLVLSTEIQAREISNASRFGGRVLQVLVKEGDRVKKGDLLVVFDGVDLNAEIAKGEATLSQAVANEKLLRKGADAGQLRQASAAVEQSKEKLNLLSKGADPEVIKQAKSRFEIAKSQYEQSQELTANASTMLEKGIISQQKYDETKQQMELAKSNMAIAEAGLKQLESGHPVEEKRSASAQLAAASAQYRQLTKGAKPEEVEIAAANVAKAKSLLDSLRKQQSEIQIKAPFSGYVSVLAVTEGELVPPGQPVVSILNYDNLWADVFVPESKLPSIHLKEVVQVISQTLKKSHFEGAVTAINPKSEFVPSSGGSNSSEESAFRVKVAINGTSLDKKAVLYPGMKVDIVFSEL